MHIHISKKMLEVTKFSVERMGNSLNIKGYDRESVAGKGCRECLLRSFSNNQTINIEELEGEKSCSCKMAVSPMVTFKVDTNKTKTITIV